MLRALGYREPRENNDPSKIENVFFGVKGVKNNSTKKNNSKGYFNTLKGYFGFNGTAPAPNVNTNVEEEEAISVISNNNNNKGKGNNMAIETISMNEVPATMPATMPSETPAPVSLNANLAAIPPAPKRRGLITNEELRAARAAAAAKGTNTGFGRNLFNTTLRASGGKRKAKRKSVKRKSRNRKSRRNNRK